MEKVLIVRYGEIALKGLNKRFFEDKLIKNIRHALSFLGKFRIYKEQCRIYVEMNEANEEDIINQVIKVFGVVSVSPAKMVRPDMELIKAVALEAAMEKLNEEKVKTFKVESRRGDKSFHLKSPEINSIIGGYLLSQLENLTVDVHNPDMIVTVEVRKAAYVYSRVINGFGGLPIGTNGKALLLLSGGIDSPVAGWMTAKRGVEIEAVHFHSYPFTSERAKEKVIELAKILSVYCGEFKLYSVNLLSIQKEINEKCPEEEMTILSRRFMMKIAEKIGESAGCDALITGESIGQVASQTLKSLYVTNAAVKMPVFRPLIALDKMEIVPLAKKINTYETSILPYEDCCTVFLPKHPVTQPQIDKIIRSEKLTEEAYLINEAIENMETEIIRLSNEY